MQPNRPVHVAKVQPRAACHPASPALQARRVLVVGDDPVTSLSVVDALWDAGAASVGPATTMAEALALLAATAPHAAVLDFALAGETAAVVAEALMAHGVAFVIVTGGADHPVLAAHPRAPVLRKPVDPGALLAALARQLRPPVTAAA